PASVAMAVVQQVTTVTTSHSSAEWSSGVCDCCSDLGVCCCGMFCFPCLMCHTASEFGWCCCMPLLETFCFAYTGINPLPCPVSICLRSSMRKRYGINGSLCGDFCTLCFCYSCTWCQMAREIKRQRGRTSAVTTTVTQI
ncbi:CNFN protein, partial [Atractosteus spatula]|nr:CNFN protein [Atractosteus spatula]